MTPEQEPREGRVEHLSDHGLLALVGRGDREAFARLYDMYGGAAYSLAVRIVRDRGAADYARLRDEVERTLALAGAERTARVVGFGAEAPELLAALRADGFDARPLALAGEGEPSSGWLEAALS